MKIYDISQEVFSCNVYPGDPLPLKKAISTMEKGDLYNLTEFSMCAHNGTHIDAPFHFFKEGKTVDNICLNTFIGLAYVAKWEGEILKDDAIKIIEKARSINLESAKRILIKGDIELTNDGAEIFAENKVLLLGTEGQSISEKSTINVHKTLLGANVIILEGIILNEVNEGVYFLNSAPLNLKGADGSPCRAVLIEQ